jgi:hypothetical protein
VLILVTDLSTKPPILIDGDQGPSTALRATFPIGNYSILVTRSGDPFQTGVSPDPLVGSLHHQQIRPCDTGRAVFVSTGNSA